MDPGRRSQDWQHMLAMFLFMIVIAGGLVYLFLHTDFVPNAGSAERELIDGFIKVLFAIAAVFFAVIITVLGYALLFFRRQKGDESDARPIRGNTALEITWTVIPLIIVIALSIHGATVLDKMMASVPAGSTQSVYSLGVFVPSETPASSSSTEPELVVNVTASRFVWEFAYPEYNINTVYELVVPINRRILFNIHSTDVIHSFWVQQWGPKQDAVPGLSPVLRITPTEIGQFTVQCSQLCGFGHTSMTAPVRVVSAADFDRWVQKQQASTSTPSPPAGTHVMIDLTAQNIAFNQSTITVPNSVEVMINFENKDNGMPHNFAIYTDSSAEKSLFVGQIITGPSQITYTFPAPASGTYFFRCDVHPTVMTGTFIVK